MLLQEAFRITTRPYYWPPFGRRNRTVDDVRGRAGLHPHGDVERLILRLRGRHHPIPAGPGGEIPAAGRDQPRPRQPPDRAGLLRPAGRADPQPHPHARHPGRDVRHEPGHRLNARRTRPAQNGEQAMLAARAKMPAPPRPRRSTSPRLRRRHGVRTLRPGHGRFARTWEWSGLGADDAGAVGRYAQELIHRDKSVSTIEESIDRQAYRFDRLGANAAAGVVAVWK